MTLGPADERLKGFAKAVKELGVAVFETVSLPTLAAFISECRLFIGSDSGVSHLAALVGIPTVVFFGPTNPDIWAPRGSHVRIVRERWEEFEVLDWSMSQAEASLDPYIMESMTSLLLS
jgi:ADP-heptose:LPS heptosyltransferase